MSNLNKMIILAHLRDMQSASLMHEPRGRLQQILAAYLNTHHARKYAKAEGNPFFEAPDDEFEFNLYVRALAATDALLNRGEIGIAEGLMGFKFPVEDREPAKISPYLHLEHLIELDGGCGEPIGL